MDKDRTVYLLSIVVILQIIMFAGLAVWHVNVITDIEEEAEYATFMAYTANDRSMSVGELGTEVYMELEYVKDRVTALENETDL